LKETCMPSLRFVIMKTPQNARRNEAAGSISERGHLAGGEEMNLLRAFCMQHLSFMPCLLASLPRSVNDQVPVACILAAINGLDVIFPRADRGPPL
jgi:hypothetical protein